MRVAVVAGPDPGHVFPAIALCLRFLTAGDTPVLLTGPQWLDTARRAGIDARELQGLDPSEDDDDSDAGAKIHQRAARMAVLNIGVLQELAVDLVVGDVLTACAGMAADLLGIAWVELNPHPLYRPSRGLPPLGSGLAPGVGFRGRVRDSLMRAATMRSWKQGVRQRSQARKSIGLPAADPGPRRRLIATLPALEVPRPDWPEEAVIVGPLHFEPTTAVLPIPPGAGPVIMVAPSTAMTGVAGLVEMVMSSVVPGESVPVGSRVIISHLHDDDGDDDSDDDVLPPWFTAGLGRQDIVLNHADVVICGGGHGMLSKTLLAGVPMVVVPGGGDQWELANRVARQGSARMVRPLNGPALVAAVGEVLAQSRFRHAAWCAGASVRQVADPVRVCHEALSSKG